MHAELCRDGALQAEEDHGLSIGRYFNNELLLMLERAGFTDVPWSATATAKTRQRVQHVRRTKVEAGKTRCRVLPAVSVRESVERRTRLRDRLPPSS